jgi:hypothetical protein
MKSGGCPGVAEWQLLHGQSNIAHSTLTALLWWKFRLPASNDCAHPALQLERLAADKAAQQLAMERELQQARTEAQSVKRRGAMDRSLSMGMGGAAAAADEGMVPMDSLGHAYRRWVGAGCEGAQPVLLSATIVLLWLQICQAAHTHLVSFPPTRPSLSCRLADNNRVGGAVKAGAQLIDSTATQVSMCSCMLAGCACWLPGRLPACCSMAWLAW